MSARDLLAQKIESWFGLDVARGGRLDALERVLTQRAESARFASLDAYVAALEGPEDPEIIFLLDTITVGHTWFFRDEEQTQAILSKIALAARDHSPVHVWVAGCSTGEDAYTVAMLADAEGISVDVLGTDVNPYVLDRARGGRYAEWSTRQVAGVHKKHFKKVDRSYALDPAILGCARFERHNLVDAPPKPRGAAGWDVIVCRNVLIYFRRPTADRAITQLAQALRPGGWLFLGASEVLHTAPPRCRVGIIGSRVAIERLRDGAAPERTAPVPQPTTPKPRPVEPPVPAPVPAPASDELMARALHLTEAGRHDEAIMLCAKVLQTEPLSVDAHLVSGIAFHLGNDPEAAVRALRGALLLDPELWPALFYLGQALEKLGRTEEAAEAYGQADLRSRASTSGRLGVLEAYRSEITALARTRSRHLARGQG